MDHETDCYMFMTEMCYLLDLKANIYKSVKYSSHLTHDLNIRPPKKKKTLLSEELHSKPSDTSIPVTKKQASGHTSMSYLK